MRPRRREVQIAVGLVALSAAVRFLYIWTVWDNPSVRYPMGDSLYIYKRNATYQVRYVGSTSVFSFRKVQAAIGALSPRSVCDIGGAHLIVTDGDVMLFDGTSRRSLGESRIRDYLFNLLCTTVTFMRFTNKCITDITFFIYNIICRPISVS